MPKLLIIMMLSTFLIGFGHTVLGASHDRFTEMDIVTVRHITPDGIQDTYYFHGVTGHADLYKRCGEQIKKHPDLSYECFYDALNHTAWLITYKK